MNITLTALQVVHFELDLYPAEGGWRSTMAAVLLPMDEAGRVTGAAYDILRALGLPDRLEHEIGYEGEAPTIVQQATDAQMWLVAQHAALVAQWVGKTFGAGEVAE